MFVVLFTILMDLLTELRSREEFKVLTLSQRINSFGRYCTSYQTETIVRSDATFWQLGPTIVLQVSTKLA